MFNGIEQFKLLALLKAEKFVDYRSNFPEEDVSYLRNPSYARVGHFAQCAQVTP